MLTNRRLGAYKGHALYAFSSKKLVPALRWPFPVIVQCCETEKAMCVDAKVNLAHRNYYYGSQGSGWDGYFSYSCREIDGEHPKQHCGLSRV